MMDYTKDQLRDMLGLRHQCTVCGDWVDAPENEDGECYHCVALRQLRQHVDKRTNQLLRAHRAADKMRSAMARMIGTIAQCGDSELFARVMPCQRDLEAMDYEGDGD